MMPEWDDVLERLHAAVSDLPDVRALLAVTEKAEQLADRSRDGSTAPEVLAIERPISDDQISALRTDWQRHYLGSMSYAAMLEQQLLEARRMVRALYVPGDGELARFVAARLQRWEKFLDQ